MGPHEPTFFPISTPPCDHLPHMSQQFPTFFLYPARTVHVHCGPGLSVGMKINIIIFNATTYVELFVSYPPRTR